MADTVAYLLEEQIPDLEDFERRGIFTKPELKYAVLARTVHPLAAAALCAGPEGAGAASPCTLAEPGISCRELPPRSGPGRAIIKKRTDFEYLLKRRAALREDFLRAIDVRSRHPCHHYIPFTPLS